MPTSHPGAGAGGSLRVHLGVMQAQSPTVATDAPNFFPCITLHLLPKAPGVAVTATAATSAVAQKKPAQPMLLLFLLNL